MNSITKIIVALIGLTAIGIFTYYILSKDDVKQVEKIPVITAEKDTVTMAKVVIDTNLTKIKKALSIDGEKFNPTETEGVYTNESKDKLLIIQEDIWKKMLRKAKKKFPQLAEDCNAKYKIEDLSDYKFVGLMTYFAEKKRSKRTTAYRAIEIRNGKAIDFSGGEICCTCEGEPLVEQKVDVVLIK
jgi:DNA-binding SARP family transcriptional activator